MGLFTNPFKRRQTTPEIPISVQTALDEYKTKHPEYDVKPVDITGNMGYYVRNNEKDKKCVVIDCNAESKCTPIEIIIEQDMTSKPVSHQLDNGDSRTYYPYKIVVDQRSNTDENKTFIEKYDNKVISQEFVDKYKYIYELISKKPAGKEEERTKPTRRTNAVATKPTNDAKPSPSQPIYIVFILYNVNTTLIQTQAN